MGCLVCYPVNVGIVAGLVLIRVFVAARFPVLIRYQGKNTPCDIRVHLPGSSSRFYRVRPSHIYFCTVCNFIQLKTLQRARGSCKLRRRSLVPKGRFTPPTDPGNLHGQPPSGDRLKATPRKRHCSPCVSNRNVLFGSYLSFSLCLLRRLHWGNNSTLTWG